MNPPDDESILSGFLDDELDDESRRQVEADLALDPALADRLAALGSARDLVAALPRPSIPCCLASAILARAATERFRPDRSPSRDLPSPIATRRASYRIATAASLLFAFALTLRSMMFGPPGGPGAIPPATGPGPHDGGASATATGVNAFDLADAASGASTRIVEAEYSRLAPIVDPSREESRRLTHLLDGPGLRRILIVTEAMDPKTAPRIDAMFRETSRKQPEFARLTVAPEIVLDPDHPRRAEVFVAVMDAKEREEFLVKLRSAGYPILEEPITPPGLGTQLADLGGIGIGSGPRAAGLLDVGPNQASLMTFKTEDASRNVVGVAGGTALPSPVGSPATSRNPAPVPASPVTTRGDDRQPTGVVSAPVAEPVLVWITSGPAVTPAKR